LRTGAYFEYFCHLLGFLWVFHSWRMALYSCFRNEKE